ncbi:MAG: TrkA C-terminal domain-containing protein [Thermoanaerobacteraceae bacterium]|nr:TrkA C-terminal domain-containing protein [Thermoanaerobacteraceae bacterium]
MTEIVRPKYQQIALDIARRIVKGEFLEGKRLHGRSNLAGLYNVSPETIRRAVSLLEDMDVVTSEQGSGITVKSKEAAYKYIDRFNEKDTLDSLRNELSRLLQTKKEIDERFEETIMKISDYASRLKNINPYNPVEIEIKKGSHVIGKSITELKFWQNTGATIIAIRRGNDIILSPGPYNEINEGDVLVLVGDEDILKNTMEFLYGSY